MTLLSLGRNSIALSLVASIAYYSRFSEAASFMESNRYGNYLVEESIRTTSHPDILVAQVGFYNQSGEDHWGTYDPVSVQNVTIELSSGQVYLGTPEGLPIDEPLPSTVPTKNYTVEVDDPSTAVLTGGDLAEPLAFEYSKFEPEFGPNLQDVFIYSDALERGFFFQNRPRASNGPPSPYGSDTDPVVAIFDLADPTDVTMTELNYTGSPPYFNGPPRNHWDSIQVVELKESGNDVFVTAYFGYNETDVWLVDTHGFGRDAFNLNAVATEGEDAFAYNARHVLQSFPHDESTVTPIAYRLSKQNIATGEIVVIDLNGTLVNDPLPISELQLTLPMIVVEANANYTFDLEANSSLPTAVERSGSEAEQEKASAQYMEVEEEAYSAGSTAWARSGSFVWIASSVVMLLKMWC